MAEFQIDPNRYRLRQNQRSKPNPQRNPEPEAPGTAEASKPKESAQDTPQEAAGERERTPAEKRLDSYRRLVDWLEEENRRRLEEQKRTKPPEEKKPSFEEIRMKVLAIRGRLRKGGRLTGEEKAYLARNAPGELEKLLRAERERSTFKARLEGCKSKEEAERAYQSAYTAAMGADISDPDFASVLIGQLSVALREMSEKPTEAQLERLDPKSRPDLDYRA